MVVNHLNQIDILFAPVEADAPPVVDADTVLALPIPGQLLKPIAGRDPKVGQALGVVKHAKLAVGDLLDVHRETSGAFACENLRRLSIPE
jgi:hypothetical protein